MTQTALRTVLRNGRKSRGLTQSGAGKQLGVTQEYMSRIENGKVPINAELVLKMAKLYNLEIPRDQLIALSFGDRRTPGDEALSDNERLLVTAVREGDLNAALRAVERCIFPGRKSSQ